MQRVLPASLAAKSALTGRQPLSLQDHSLQTAEAARLAFDLRTRVGRNFCLAFGLNDEESKIFFLNLQVACLLHDIGKANEGFANAVAGRKNAQVIRHEHLSAIFMMQKGVRQWLSGSPAINFPVILAAVVSHHLKADQRTFADMPGCLNQTTALFFDHPEVSRILFEIAQLAGLPAIQSAQDAERFDKRSDVWANYIDEILRTDREVVRALRKSDAESSSLRKLLTATRTALIVADSIASGVVREGRSIADWITANLHVPSLSSSELRQLVIDQRLESIAHRTGSAAGILPFQKCASEQGDRAVLVAGCGVGKTLSGLLWAANRLEQHQRGRVLVLYPTRATATEGFRDYIAWAPAKETYLLHGSSDYELQCMLNNPSEAAVGKDFCTDENARLYALATYPRRYYSATVDQFLGCLSNSYSAICRLPLLTDSVVILDEVHSFDKQLFENVLDYLKNLQIPTLCMTATLQPERKAELHKLGLSIFPNDWQRELFEDLQQKENHPRYSVQWLPDVRVALPASELVTNEMAASQCIPTEIMTAVEHGLTSGSRILWVVNTVGRCQTIARLLGKHYPNQVIAYHSRFKLMDRQNRHKDCIERLRFGSSSQSVIAVTTQVCEMSLDLDADILVTECAPVESLIQRFGRANRHPAYRPNGFLAEIIVYTPTDLLPYKRDELASAHGFLDWIVAQPSIGISQRQLAEGIDNFSKQASYLEPASRLFGSGIFATPGELRDIDNDFMVPAILDADVDEVKRCLSARTPIDGFIVPVPERTTLPSSPDWLPGHMKMAPVARYDPEFGFS
jgi:CRISPR-associated endonuclease/helicase Cas3